MNVIFIRHGKAEPHTFEKPDFDRELTTEGKDDLLENIPYLINKLDLTKTKIFSSPLVRAYQTAQFISDDFELVDFLASGDIEELKEYVNNNRKYETLIFVGHEPILSEWIYELTNEFITVKKGMAIQLLWPDKVIRSTKLKDYQSL